MDALRTLEMQFQFQFLQVAERVGEPHQHDVIPTGDQPKNIPRRQFKAIPGRLHCCNSVGADFVRVQLDPPGRRGHHSGQSFILGTAVLEGQVCSGAHGRRGGSTDNGITRNNFATGDNSGPTHRNKCQNKRKSKPGSTSAGRSRRAAAARGHPVEACPDFAASRADAMSLLILRARAERSESLALSRNRSRPPRWSTVRSAEADTRS